MSKRLKMPTTINDYTSFVEENKGLKIKKGTDTYEQDDLTFKGDFMFALEVNEIMSDVEAEIDVPDYDDEGNPIMIDKKIDVPDYDDEGNLIGHHTEIIKVQSYHKETVTVYKPVINPNYEQEEAEKRKAEFNKAFFNTSLGYIRRSVTMKDGRKRDFLSDLVLQIKAGLEAGLDVKILAYDEPDFTSDIEDWTQYQHEVSANAQFIMECLQQTVTDFR